MSTTIILLLTFLVLCVSLQSQPGNEPMARAREWHGEASGRTHTKEYHAWAAMKDRCNNPECAAFPYYGGRGITVCDRWNNSYVAFLEDMGRSAENESLDRINNNEGYYKENCRWTIHKVQSNNRRDNVSVTYNGEKMTFIEACEKSGTNRNTARSRKMYGKPESEWFAPSADGRGKHGNQQGNNTLFTTHNGKEMTVDEAAELAGLRIDTVRYRIRAGWPENEWLLPADAVGNRLKQL